MKIGSDVTARGTRMAHPTLSTYHDLMNSFLVLCTTTTLTPLFFLLYPFFFFFWNLSGRLLFVPDMSTFCLVSQLSKQLDALSFLSNSRIRKDKN